MSILEQFALLAAQPSGSAYTVAELVEAKGLLLGIDQNGHPALFVEVDSHSQEPPIRTGQISIQLGKAFEFRSADRTPSRGTFHALRCETANPSDVRAFLLLVEALAGEHREEPPSSEVLVTFFRSLARLFSVDRARDLEAERQGLWGELFMMSTVRGFRFWSPFWHTEPSRRFDFSSLSGRVEVKTVTEGVRVHHFSHGQLFQTVGPDIIVASLMLRADDIGVSLRNLIVKAQEMLSDSPSLLKLERAIRVAGMESLDEEGPRFDARDAERLLAWYWASEAPHFQIPEPPGVSGTRYRVDLSTAPMVEAAALENWLDQWGEDKSGV